MMNDRNDSSSDRAETARQNDDSDLIGKMEDAPAEGGMSGPNVAHNVATRDEMKQEVGEGSVTRVRNSDKKDDANLPRYNQGNSNLNP